MQSSGRFLFLRVVTDDAEFSRGFRLLVSTVSGQELRGLSFRLLVSTIFGQERPRGSRCQVPHPSGWGLRPLTHTTFARVPAFCLAMFLSLSLPPAGPVSSCRAGSPSESVLCCVAVSEPSQHGVSPQDLTRVS